METHNYFRPRNVEHFAGNVIQIPEPQPKETQPPSPPRLALDAALQVLGQVSIETELRNELIAELRSVVERANSLLERNHVARLEDLRRKHKAIVIECRSKTDAINELLVSMGKMEGSLRSAGEKSGRARLLFTAAQRNPPLAENFPTDTELRNHENAVAKLRAALEDAEENESSWNGQHQALGRDLMTARQELARLAERELVLRNALNGEPTRDKSTGLYIEPQAVR